MKLLKTLMLLATPFMLKAQPNVYNGNAQLGTQAAVDAFGSQYTVVTGKLQVYGANVKNLAALSNIDTVRGKLEILTTDSLKSLDGLNLLYVGNNVYFEGNKKLRSISALTTLRYIGKDLIIMDCDSLRSLNGLENVDSLKGNIYIGVQGWSTPPVAKSNDSLDNLCALSHVITSGGFTGTYHVANNAYNPLAGDFAQGRCANPVFDGNVQLGSQAEIDAFSSQYKIVTGKLQIFGATPKNLAPLANIDTVRGKLEILTTDSLTSLAGLRVKYVGSNVYLDGNKSLQNINALRSLRYIGKDLVILECDRLKLLDSLSSVDSIKGSIYIGTEAWKTPPGAKGNDSLVSFCGLTHVLSTNGLTGTYNADFNAFNPLKSDIISGKCQKPVAIEDVPETSNWKAYTTPSHFVLAHTSGSVAMSYKLVNMNGQTLASGLAVSSSIAIEHTALPAGLYLIVAENEKGISRFKMIK